MGRDAARRGFWRGAGFVLWMAPGRLRRHSVNMRLHRKHKSALLGFGFVALAVGFGVAASARYADSQKERRRLEQERGELKPPEPRPVMVESRALVLRRTYSVEIAPWISARAPSEVAGRVVKTRAEAGQPVKAGDPLIEIDDRRARIALEEAEARDAEAKRLLAEARRLRSSNVVSASQLEAAAAEARIAAARLADARDHLERHVIRAPFDGVVNQRFVDEGDAVAPNEPAVSVLALDRLRLRFDVAAADLAAFRPGAVVTVRPGLPRASPREARVAFVAPSADPVTRLFRVEAEMPNTGEPLPGGLQGTVEAEVAVFPEGPVLPAAAVRFRGRGAVVLVASDEGATEAGPAMSEREVEVGPEVDGFYPVLAGIEAGERIYIR